MDGKLGESGEGRKRRRKGEGAIYSYCDKCFTGNALDAQTCSKCGAPFGRSRKYRVINWHKGERTTKVVDNLTLARQIAGAVKTDNIRGEFNIDEKKPKKAPTLAEVWVKYLSWAKEHKKTWDDDLGNYTKHLEPRFGKKRLDAISAMDVNRLKLEMTKGKTKDGAPYLSKRGKLFSAATIKHQLVLLQRLYKFAQGPDFKYMGATPFDHKQVVMPHLDNALPRFLSQEQLTALWEALDTWPDKTTVGFIKLALFTGVRRGTLFPLKWADVDFDRNMITLVVSHRRKGTETITKQVSPEAIEVLKAMPRTESSYVFPRKAAGLPDTIRFHDLRHTFGSYHAMEGTDLQVIQQLMNHRDFRTTLKYAHLSKSVVNTAAARSGELLTPKTKADVIILK
jgi:integrase/ribosomal protein L37E